MTRKEAIKILMGYSHTSQERAALEVLIPELAESEDERIVKAIIGILKNSNAIDINVSQETMISWLEKQKEQKPAEWSEEDERMRNQLIYDVECHKKEGLISAKQNKATKTLYDGIEKCYDEKISWLKSLRPSWKPSEEQMEALKRASMNEYLSAKQFDILVSLYEQLKKL